MRRSGRRDKEVVGQRRIRRIWIIAHHLCRDRIDSSHTRDVVVGNRITDIAALRSNQSGLRIYLALRDGARTPGIVNLADINTLNLGKKYIYT